MAHHRVTISTLPTALIEELHDTLVLKPADDSQRTAQVEMVKALHTALDARRQRIVISKSSVGTVEWVGILLQGLCLFGRCCRSLQRQPAHLRYNFEPFCNRHSTVRAAHRRI